MISARGSISRPKISGQLQFLDQFRLGWMAGLGADDFKRANVFVIEPIQLGDENVNWMREDERHILNLHGLSPALPPLRGAEVQFAGNLNVKIRLLAIQAGGADEFRHFLRGREYVHICATGAFCGDARNHAVTI